MAGLGVLPGDEELREQGVLTFEDDSADPPPPLVTAEQPEVSEKDDTVKIKEAAQLSLGTGLGFIPKKLVEKIRATEYVDFAELPPAKGKNRPISQTLEGQIVVIQAADLAQARKLIPDLATWLQCFAMYVAALEPKPAKLRDLMAYQAMIAKASLKFRWPSWVVYDQNFRLEVAGNPRQAWARADSSIYTQCFLGQAVSMENWCRKCQSLDHSTDHCPFQSSSLQSRKRPWNVHQVQSIQR